MPNRNKTRVFVALYSRQGITSHEQSHELGYARFHWAIWTEPKGSTGDGSCYQVIKADTYVNIPDSGGWRYNYIKAANCPRSRSMLGRIMVGKIPNGIDQDAVDDVLSKVPVPRDNTDPAENCVSWTLAALKELVQHGWVDDYFDLEHFMDWALERATEWCSIERRPDGQKEKLNYTRRPFP
ncbi:hypothetical protein F5B22DRAFT_656366 [Xylaria bambusicola]|uniref:uncharacterized protein n=1 Tax=Xylaria bambusicola TaxID=326684 RepID=UPI00200729C1|nr:uncharacterized protein F5B22DRAFT_656366 [Xylaria bambusicola]KAI0515180.1 hypothetical protein F5B22DRAFT_656366 [Xylaria bambusicola]